MLFFNFRWFELKTEFGENGRYVLVLSELRRDPDYVQVSSLLIQDSCLYSLFH